MIQFAICVLVAHWLAASNRSLWIGTALLVLLRKRRPLENGLVANAVQVDLVAHVKVIVDWLIATYEFTETLPSEREEKCKFGSPPIVILQLTRQSIHISIHCH